MRAALFIVQMAVMVSAAILCSDRAEAYSGEAVADAQTLVDAEIARAGADADKSADVALARYYLAEMQYKAGRLSETNFCRSAASDLQTVAGEFEDAEEPSADEKQWHGEIAGMASSSAICRKVAAATTLLLFHGDQRSPPAGESFADAQARFAKAKDDFAIGEVTQYEVAFAQYDLLTVQLHAGQMSHDAYCQAVLPVLQTIVDKTEEQARVGESALWDEVGARRQLFGFKASCIAGAQIK